MKASIILCTYNRCESLRRALDSLASSVTPDSLEWEVLVVDNNSQDQTREVVSDYLNRHSGRFRYVFEGKQGKSHALNRGIQEAYGDLLVFTDDDIWVEPSWLENLTAVFSEERWIGAGGRILPDPGFSPPQWLSGAGRYALAPLALFDQGSEKAELAEPPFGANMAFRKAVFEKHGGFRTDLGPCAGTTIQNEDTEFGRRVMASGERLCYVASAVVYHPAPKVRLEKKYHLDWWFAKGQADVREFGIPSGPIRVFGTPVFLFRRVTMLTLRWMFALEPSRRFAFKLKLWSVAGVIKECFRDRRNREKRARTPAPEGSST